MMKNAVRRTKNANRRLYSRCGRSMIVSHTLEVDDAGLIHRIHFSGRGAGSAASHTPQAAVAAVLCAALINFFS